jgi:hypothetical protein
LITNRCFHLAQSFPDIKFKLDFKGVSWLLSHYQ